MSLPRRLQTHRVVERQDVGHELRRVRYEAADTWCPAACGGKQDGGRGRHGNGVKGAPVQHMHSKAAHQSATETNAMPVPCRVVREQECADALLNLRSCMPERMPSCSWI